MTCYPDDMSRGAAIKQLRVIAKQWGIKMPKLDNVSTAAIIKQLRKAERDAEDILGV